MNIKSINIFISRQITKLIEESGLNNPIFIDLLNKLYHRNK